MKKTFTFAFLLLALTFKANAQQKTTDTLTFEVSISQAQYDQIKGRLDTIRGIVQWEKNQVKNTKAVIALWDSYPPDTLKKKDSALINAHQPPYKELRPGLMQDIEDLEADCAKKRYLFHSSPGDGTTPDYYRNKIRKVVFKIPVGGNFSYKVYIL